MRCRSWSLSRSPRILSKYFSAEGGFFGDFDAKYLPVKGFAWFPAGRLQDAEPVEVLAAYVCLFNSMPFVKLLAIYCPHVSGGQYALEPRYVNAIPIPDLGELNFDPVRSQLVAGLAALGREVNLRESRWRARVDYIVTELYGRDIIAAL